MLFIFGYTLVFLIFPCEFRGVEVRKVLFGSESIEILNQHVARQTGKEVVRQPVNEEEEEELASKIIRDGFKNLQDNLFGEKDVESQQRQVIERTNPNPLIPDTSLLSLLDLSGSGKKESLEKLGMQQYASDLMSQGYLLPSDDIQKELKYPIIALKKSENPSYYGMRSGLSEKQNVDGLANLVETVQNQQHAFEMMKQGFLLPSQYPAIKPPADFERPLLKMIQHLSE